MEIGIEHKALIDTNYCIKYDEIFENNYLKLNEQILAIKVLDIYSSSKAFSGMNYRDRNNKLF